MTKQRLLTIAVIGLLLVNMGMLAFWMTKKPEHPLQGRPPMQQQGPKQMIMERLHLDADQVATYENLIANHQQSIQALDDSIRMVKNGLYALLTADAAPAKDSLINRLGFFQKQIEETHYDHFAQLKKICRPDQLNDFNNLTTELSRFMGSPKKGGPQVVEKVQTKMEPHKEVEVAVEDLKKPLKEEVPKQEPEKAPKPDKLGPPPPGQGEQGPPPGVEEIFAQMDSNKDGKLSIEEVKGPLKNDFSKIDTNGDGFISKEELEKAPKPDRQGPPPGQAGPTPPVKN